MLYFSALFNIMDNLLDELKFVCGCVFGLGIEGLNASMGTFSLLSTVRISSQI